MKHFLGFLFFVLISVNSSIAQMNVNMLGSWDDDTLPTHFYGTFNDCWGYAAEGREYAIMGSASFVHIFDVTDPQNIEEIERFQPGDNTTWRDFKTYENYLYIASDNTNEGLQIFDLSFLPDSVAFIQKTTEFFINTHNIYIDEPNGRLYAVGGPTTFVVLDLATDPENPTLLDFYAFQGGTGYIHDVYVKDNIAYASQAYDGYYIYDYSNAEEPVLLASVETNGYNHSSWVTEDGQTAIFAEEVPTGLPMGSANLSNVANGEIEVLKYFKFPLLAPNHEDSTPHNPYIIGDKVYTSYYEDGFMIFDISDPANPFLEGYYDTYPSNTSYNGYAGCWGVYPFLPSGNILASDMDNGLFILEYDPEPITNTLNFEEERFHVRVFPNPTFGELTIQYESNRAFETTYEISTITGQILKTGQVEGRNSVTIPVDLSAYDAGIFLVKVTDGEQHRIKKIIKK